MALENYSLKAQAGYLFAAKVIAFAIHLLVPIILVRLFTQEEYGLYKQVLLVCMFFFPCLALGDGKESVLLFSVGQGKTDAVMVANIFFHDSGGTDFSTPFLFIKKPDCAVLW